MSTEKKIMIAKSRCEQISKNLAQLEDNKLELEDTINNFNVIKKNKN